MSRFPHELLDVYAGRSIGLTDLANLARSVERRPVRPDDLARAHARLLDSEFYGRVEQLKLLRQDRDVLTMIDRRHEAGEIDSFQFEGRRYDSADAVRLLRRIERRMEEEERWWADFDRRVFEVHYRMACDLGGGAADDLKSRYEFQLGLQDVQAECSHRRRRLSRIASFVNDSDEPLEFAEFHQVRTALMEAQDAFERCLRDACRLRPPRLPSVPEGQPLANVLLTGTPVPRLKPVAQTVSGRWLGKFGRQLDEVRENARRVRAEALGPLLARLAWVARRWEEERTKLPDVEEVEAEAAETDTGRAAREDDLQPLDDEPEFELSEEDVWTGPPEAIQEPDADLDEEPVAEEIALTDKDVLPEPEEAGPGVEMEDIDPDDHTNRPRHWDV